MPYKDPEKAKEYKHSHYLKYKEKYICSAKRWTKNNPEKRKVIVKNNNAKSYIRKRRWAEKYFYDNNATTIGKKCFLCNAYNNKNKSKSLHIHHINGKNGKFGRKLDNNPNNLIILCVSCHAKVHSRWNFKNIYEYKNGNCEGR